MLQTTVRADNTLVMKGLRTRARVSAGVLVVLLAMVGSPAMAGTLLLEWDPNSEPNVTGYRVYIGTASGEYDRVVDLGLETTFAMTDAQPGVRYYFAVAAVAGWRLSNKSLEVSGVSVAAPRSQSAIAPDSSGARAGRAMPLSGETCAGSAAALCFQYEQISPLLGEVHSLSAAPDGQLFVVEDRQRIRVLVGGQPATEPAYVATDGQLEHVVVDPAFARTGWVFASEMTPRRDGTVELNIVRLSYLAGTLGQPARIVTGIVADSGSAAPFALSPSGVIYVATPGVDRSPDSGRVIAFTVDGRPLRDSVSGSLLWGPGLPDPVSMWMAQESVMPWLAGRDERGEPVAGLVNMTGAARASSPLNGDPTAAAGPLGIISIQGGKVLATAPGPSGAILVSVAPQPPAPGAERTVIVRLTPAR